MQTLEGKTAVITGSSRGFGFSVARAYLEAGASVVISSRSQDSVSWAVEQLHGGNGRTAGMVCDVAIPEQVEDLRRFAEETFGGFDIWVNNAGLSAPYGPTAHIPPEYFVKVTQTNILGTYYGSITALRRFLPLRSGKLINILGRGDTGPQPLQNAYASTKAWILNFTRAMAKEYKNSGVGIFAFNPGLMRTELLQDLEVIEGYQHHLDIMETILRMWAVRPEIPAKKMVWLASSATDDRTGLVVRQMSPGGMLRGALREGLRRLTGKPKDDVQVNLRIVQAALNQTGGFLETGKGRG